MLIQRFKQAGSFVSLAMMLAIAACNNEASTDSTDATVATPAETKADTSIVAKPKKTGKVSVSLDKPTPATDYKKGPDGIYESVQVQPGYPGGETALSTYISNALIYPDEALNENTEGTVRVQFIVNEDGKVSNALVVGTAAGHGLDQAAVDVVNKMENWTPGKVNGKNVKTRMVLPVVYRLE